MVVRKQKKKEPKRKVTKPHRKLVSTRKRAGESRVVMVTCRKCNNTFKLDIGNKTREEVEQSLANQREFECPGHHVELSSPLNYWVIDWNSVQDMHIPSDKEWLAQRKKEGYTMISSDELRNNYTVTGFSMGLCMARSKKDGKDVVLDFVNSPEGHRYYY